MPALMPSLSLSPNVVSRHGRLQVQGNKIVDRKGKAVSLAGISLFWGNVDWHGERFWNAEVVDFLKEDWKATIVRAAMGVEDPGGYLQYPENNLKKLQTVVDACIMAGVYVIIDWHSHDAKPHQAEAVAFFSKMARLYGGNDHVIYEIWNEPRHVTWPDTIKPYSEAVIAAIRKYDPDNLIIVGSPDWSTAVDISTADPVEDPNVAYSFHFYAASHFQKKQMQAQAALDRNKALFITEWGSCESTGNGKIDRASTEEWSEWMRKNQLSHCNWSLCDKAESASVLRPGAYGKGEWTEDQLTSSGLMVRKMVREWNKTGRPKSAGQRSFLAPWF
jgi:endoglucanase